jgi:hypothetical protein
MAFHRFNSKRSKHHPRYDSSSKYWNGSSYKKKNSRIAEQRTNELYNRFNNSQINVQELLDGLNFFVTNE